MKLHSFIITGFLLLGSWVGGVSAAGPEQAGIVKVSDGSVQILRGNHILLAPVGTPVQEGDRIRTGPSSNAGVTLNDDTRLSLGPNSTLLINAFAFNTTSHEGGMVASFLKGTFSVVTGLLAKHSPGSVTFKTPASTLGIRGTEFVVDVEGGSD
ncbi:MAG: FecR domain-containing protein [Zoogloeaceae bacterium]|nr:FecR domain-containing protein [Zoogloeaceae bacterium]